MTKNLDQESNPGSFAFHANMLSLHHPYSGIRTQTVVAYLYRKQEAPPILRYQDTCNGSILVFKARGTTHTQVSGHMQ